jgi:hypothetical protein
MKSWPGCRKPIELGYNNIFAESLKSARFVLVLESGGAERGGFDCTDRCPKIGFCPDLSAVVQDDEGGRDWRTQPGV